MAAKKDSKPELIEDLDEVEPVKTAEVESSPAPGDADYDWSPHYPDGAKLFSHTFDGGKVVAIRDFGSVYSKLWLYKIRNMQTEADFQFSAIDRAACETAQAVIASVDAPLDADVDPFEELWTAWTAAATSHDGENGLSSGE